MKRRSEFTTPGESVFHKCSVPHKRHPFEGYFMPCRIKTIRHKNGKSETIPATKENGDYIYVTLGGGDYVGR